jgi:hypothetical protein
MNIVRGVSVALLAACGVLGLQAMDFRMRDDLRPLINPRISGVLDAMRDGAYQAESLQSLREDDYAGFRKLMKEQTLALRNNNDVLGLIVPSTSIRSVAATMIRIGTGLAGSVFALMGLQFFVESRGDRSTAFIGWGAGMFFATQAVGMFFAGRLAAHLVAPPYSPCVSVPSDKKSLLTGVVSRALGDIKKLEEKAKKLEEKKVDKEKPDEKEKK